MKNLFKGESLGFLQTRKNVRVIKEVEDKWLQVVKKQQRNFGLGDKHWKLRESEFLKELKTQSRKMKIEHEDAEEFVKNAEKCAKWILTEPEDLCKNFKDGDRNNEETDEDKILFVEHQRHVDHKKSARMNGGNKFDSDFITPNMRNDEGDDQTGKMDFRIEGEMIDATKEVCLKVHLNDPMKLTVKNEKFRARQWK